MAQKKRLSAASIFFETLPYHVDAETGLIDYSELEASAKNFKPDVIIAGLDRQNMDIKTANML